MYYPINDLKTFFDSSYLEINSVETIKIGRFHELNSLTEYKPEAILNLPSCDR
jgi:hypothetical protein